MQALTHFNALVDFGELVSSLSIPNAVLKMLNFCNVNINHRSLF